LNAKPHLLAGWFLNSRYTAHAVSLRNEPRSRCAPWLPLLASVAGTAHPQEVRDRVVDPTGKPLALAQIYLLPSAPTTTSDFTGAYTLKRVRAGTDTLVTRRIGFRPETLAVRVPPQGRVLTIRLTAAPAELQPVTTRALQQDLPRRFHRMKVHTDFVEEPFIRAETRFKRCKPPVVLTWTKGFKQHP
jgi:hypothetical protein